MTRAKKRNTAKGRRLAADAARRGPIAGDKFIPPCAASMGCLCAGHARGNAADAPCDTTEYAERDAAEVLGEIRELLDVEEDKHIAVTHARIVDAVKSVCDERNALYSAIEDAFGKMPADAKHAAAELEEQHDRNEALREALRKCRDDRAELLKRLSMTDRQWSAQGGACESDFDVVEEG